MNWLRAIFQASAVAQAAAQVASAPKAKPAPVLTLPMAAEWTPQAQQLWKAFLITDAGRALLQRMNAVAAFQAREAGKDTMHTTHSAARATGFDDAFHWLISQATIEFAAEPADETISGAAADQAATSAQEQNGDALLRERLSP